MDETVRIAVAGSGLIGKRHIEAMREVTGVELASVVDPAPPAKDYAAGLGSRWFASLAEMIVADRPDGVILATPNQMHVDNGLECAQAGLPTLVEKPIAVDTASATRLVEAFESAGVPLLVGHHRRHNPLIAAAKSEIDGGAIGRIVAVHGMFWLFKPEDYFEPAWRRLPGAGPVFLNLIHDIDLMRHLCGEIVFVQAQESNAVRGNDVEETAAILLRFSGGALGTVNVCDTAVSPWSWELTAKENPAYPPTGQSCYFIGGTHGAIELPNLRVWRNLERRGWWEPIAGETIEVRQKDPLPRQIRHFAAVIRGEEAPLVSGREGLSTLRVIEAVKRSAASGEGISIEP